MGDVDINDILTSTNDDLFIRNQLGDGSDVRDFPIDIQQLTRPMALLRLVRQYNENAVPGVPLFVKTHNAHMISNGIELLPEMLTKAVIFIVRDPHDVLPSFAKHMGKDLDTALEFMQDRYRTLSAPESGKVADLISSWDQHTRSFINADSHNVLLCRYESILDDPVRMFTMMLEHAGVEVDRERVEKAVELVSLANLRKKEAKDGFQESSKHATNKFFGKGGSASRHKLTPKHNHIISKKFGALIKRLYSQKKVA